MVTLVPNLLGRHSTNTKDYPHCYCSTPFLTKEIPIHLFRLATHGHKPGSGRLHHQYLNTHIPRMLWAKCLLRTVLSPYCVSFLRESTVSKIHLCKRNGQPRTWHMAVRKPVFMSQRTFYFSFDEFTKQVKVSFSLL